MGPSTRDYLVVIASYWGFTLADGALRMLVLLHFFKLGYSPFVLAFLFLLYEFAGIVANLAGGWLATRFGIPRMLVAGQTLQIAGLLMLSALDPSWTAAASVAWVVAAQGIAGLAKDFTKTASKSAIKATAGEGSSRLFKWVAWFTGSKNAMKGLGFFAGGLLLDFVGFRAALWLMAALLGIILRRRAGMLLPRQLGRAKSSKSSARAVRQVARGQPAGGGARLPVRRPRRVVRRRPARVSLRQWLALRRGRRLPRRLDDRLRRPVQAHRTFARAAQRRRPQPREYRQRGSWPALLLAVPSDPRACCCRSTAS
jgi:MFS family permease